MLVITVYLKKGYVYYFFDPLITACSDDGWSSEEVQGTAIQRCI